jgi:hypothetical protein
MFCFSDGKDRIFFISTVTARANGVALQHEVFARGFGGVLRQRRLCHGEQA